MSIERPEELDSKKRAFEGYTDLGKDEQKAFDSLKLGKPEGERYTDAEIRNGIMNTLSSGIHQANLPQAELEKAEALLREVSGGMNGMSQKEMIELYSKFRSEIRKILSLDSAKDERPRVENDIREKAQQSEAQEKLDFFLKRAQELARILETQEREKREAQKRALQGVQENDRSERYVSQVHAREELSEWPA